MNDIELLWVEIAELKARLAEIRGPAPRPKSEISRA